VGPGSDITLATLQDTPNGERLNIDQTTFVNLPAGSYRVDDFRLNVFSHNRGMVTPMLLTGAPSSYTTLWVGSAFTPTANGDQTVSESGNFTLGSATDVYAGFFTSAKGSGIIALDANNAGSGSSTTDHDSRFTAPTGPEETVAGFSHKSIPRTYAFGINVSAVDSPGLESMVVPGVADDRWTTVSLSKTYVSPIAVCTVVYLSAGLSPAVVRMKEVGEQSFKIRLQNPKGDALQTHDVHCVVVEQGSWVMPDGRKIEANKYDSTITDWRHDWTGEAQPCASLCSTPYIVLGQVMSNNDKRWSVFWSRGQKQNIAPNGSNLFTGKHVGEDTSHSRVDEVVGYILIEKGHKVSEGTEIETARGLGNVEAYRSKGTYTYNFNKAFSTTPAVAVLSQAAMRGGDGAWAVLGSDISASSMKVAVDEDEIADADDHHVGEQLDYIVFSAAGTVTLSRP
jgi:hypothetical protein